MREEFDLKRELGRGAFGEASNAAEAWRSWAIYFAVATAAGAFMAMAGAFNTGDAPLIGRLTYWIVAVNVGALWGQVIRTVLRRFPSLHDNYVLGSIATALGVAVPGTLFIWLLSGAMFEDRLGLDNLLQLLIPVLVISLAMTAVFVLIAQARTRATVAGPAPPRFLDRLPLKLRGGALYAVEAEDHYLRLHTSKGQDLILMRLTDAIGELDGIEGLQTHRSWWVAKDGVANVRRDAGKVILVLKDNAEAPVARNSVRALREAGWL